MKLQAQKNHVAKNYSKSGKQYWLSLVILCNKNWAGFAKKTLRPHPNCRGSWIVDDEQRSAHPCSVRLFSLATSIVVATASWTHWVPKQCAANELVKLCKTSKVTVFGTDLQEVIGVCSMMPWCWALSWDLSCAWQVAKVITTINSCKAKAALKNHAWWSLYFDVHVLINWYQLML